MYCLKLLGINPMKAAGGNPTHGLTQDIGCPCDIFQISIFIRVMTDAMTAGNE